MERKDLTFRVFVSSTFSDFIEERNSLQAVFRSLRSYCESNGARFQAIELRWGVAREAALDQQTMNICLDELRRCQFKQGPSAYDLAKFRRAIVYFPDGSAAASFTRCRFHLRPASNDELDALAGQSATLARFVYLPNEVEGAFLADRQGKSFGVGSVVSSAIARHLLDPATFHCTSPLAAH